MADADGWYDKARAVGRKFDFMRRRKYAYQLTFSSINGEEVLQDLARFCRASESCFDADPRIHAVLEGRREVWLRITNHLGLSSEQLLSLYDRQPMVVAQPEEDE